jgi:hypothetical protein
VAWAARKRSDFLGQISDFQDNAQLTFVKGETIVDLQASYEFQSVAERPVGLRPSEQLEQHALPGIQWH